MVARIKRWQEHIFLRSNLDVTYQSFWVAKISTVLMRKGLAWFIENKVSECFKKLKFKLKTCANFILFVILDRARATIYTLSKKMGTELKYIPFPLGVANKYKKSIKPFLFPSIPHKSKKGKISMKRVLIPISNLYKNILESYKGFNAHIMISKKTIFKQVWSNRTMQHFRWI